MLVFGLTSVGHEVVTAAEGVEALERLGEARFDIVLLDLMMPKMNGFEVLKRLKRDAALREVPVIVISALNELDSVIRCIEAGAEDFLTRPLEQRLLVARINACLRRKRWREETARVPPEAAAAAAAGEAGPDRLSDKDRKLKAELHAILEDAGQIIARKKHLSSRSVAGILDRSGKYHFKPQTLRKIIDRRYPSLYRLGVLGSSRRS